MAITTGLAGLTLPLTTGCGASLTDLKPVRWNEIGPTSMADLPLLLEVVKGDRIPVKFHIGGNLLASVPDMTEVVVEAKQTFFVLVAGDGPPRICVKTPELDCSPSKHGTFQVGLGRRQGQPVEATLALEQFVEMPGEQAR